MILMTMMMVMVMVMMIMIILLIDCDLAQLTMNIINIIMIITYFIISSLIYVIIFQTLNDKTLASRLLHFIYYEQNKIGDDYDCYVTMTFIFIYNYDIYFLWVTASLNPPTTSCFLLYIILIFTKYYELRSKIV